MLFDLVFNTSFSSGVTLSGKTHTELFLLFYFYFLSDKQN